MSKGTWTKEELEAAQAEGKDLHRVFNDERYVMITVKNCGECPYSDNWTFEYFNKNADCRRINKTVSVSGIDVDCDLRRVVPMEPFEGKIMDW